jgi:L-lactate dehydrogenase complex protein LldG
MNFYDILAMKKAFELVKKRQKENIHKIPDLQERLKRLRRVRESSVGNSELMYKAVENLESNGFNVRFAKDDKEAIRIILEEIGDENLVVKSKSNLSREIKLTERLEGKGIKVVETDIGDRLIQLLNEEPSHPTGPASHLSLDRIIKSIKEKFGVNLSSADDVVRFLLNDIKKNIELADVGITGANAITAEGSILILHNEGNIFEVLRRPRKWIILAGIDKFYPNIDEAINAAKIQTFFATGQIVPTFIEIVSGVSKTADIEKRLFKGVHNPKEITLILLDNKRSYLMNNGFREMFYCIGCGNCVIHCPVHNTFGDEFKGGRFALFSALYDGKSDLRLCLSCKRCKKNCPLGLDIPSMISRAREGSEIYNFVYSHVKWLIQTLYLETLAFYLSLKEGTKF